MGRGNCTKVVVVTAERNVPADGIHDYSTRLVDTLSARPGVEAELFHRECAAFSMAMRSPRDSQIYSCSKADAVVLQYNPFSHGRRGFAPGLPAGILKLRRAVPHATIALMVHETYVAPKNFKWALMSAWQRAQLYSLQRLADVQLCSIETWAKRLERSVPDVPVYHLPVASNLPDRRDARERSRREFGIPPDAIVLGAFGMHHPGRLTDQIVQSAEAVRRAGHRVFILNLGTRKPALNGAGSEIPVLSPGFLEADQAAEALSATDIFLAAFDDGVSTRRGTMMAAFQHEIAIVGTVGHLTDQILRDSPDAIRLAPRDRPDLFVDEVVALANDPLQRRRTAIAGRELYEAKFDWPVMVDALLGALEAHAR